jgi:hypothetical protein
VDGAAPCGVRDGRPLDLQLRHTDSGGDEVSVSPSVTMICSDVPLSPATPSLLLRSLDLLLLEWEPPADDGGSPILGYSVHMRQSGEGADYTMIYNGTQNPASRSLAITEFLGAPLEVRGYDLVIRAYNWVGVSPDTSLALALIITVRTSAPNSKLEGELLLYDDAENPTLVTSAKMRAVVPSDITAIAFDTNGLRLNAGGSNVFV